MKKLQDVRIILSRWNELPSFMRNEAVKKYYKLLEKRRSSLFVKRLFDIIVSAVVSILLLPLMIIIAFLIKLDSKGKILFKQDRVTQNGKVFKILKFRTMVENAESLGSGVTLENDARITKVGKWLRKFRLDEIPQIFNILMGDLSFVGTRPESLKYVEKYSDEMYATLLLPAGVTSQTSILYKDEDRLLKNSEEPDKTYVEDILPQKMKYNLEYVEKFGFWYDIMIMFKTVIAVIKN